MTENSVPEDAHRDDPVSANEDVARLRLQLKDYSLEQLEAIGLVEWDREANIVRKGQYFGDKKFPE
ncbi:hypothetical protein ACFQE8_16325 [Salinirubellus sp. GCM10025818]|uniref:hypothetical protein n=1 Tax=Salinirubellus TaxID=2162630 RepID=UPI0030CE038F